MLQGHSKKGGPGVVSRGFVDQRLGSLRRMRVQGDQLALSQQPQQAGQESRSASWGQERHEDAPMKPVLESELRQGRAAGCVQVGAYARAMGVGEGGRGRMRRYFAERERRYHRAIPT